MQRPKLLIAWGANCVIMSDRASQYCWLRKPNRIDSKERSLNETVEVL
jgi:hypothetical protein